MDSSNMSLIRPILLLSCLIAIVGCSGIKRGNINKVSAVSDKPRVGNVYLVRGLGGVFSTGMDELAGKIRADGVSATVFQGEQRADLTNAIAREYAGRSNAEPLVLIGHSYGADDVVRIARALKEKNITVDLLVTCDPVTPPAVPGNIHRVRNYYRPQGFLDNLPWFRGIPLHAEPQAIVRVENLDITNKQLGLYQNGANHFNIEKNPYIHEDVVKQLRTLCPPRSVWASRRHSGALAAFTPPPSPPSADNQASDGHQRPVQTADLRP